MDMDTLEEEVSEEEVVTNGKSAVPVELRVAAIKKQQKLKLDEIRKKQNETLESEKVWGIGGCTRMLVS